MAGVSLVKDETKLNTQDFILLSNPRLRPLTKDQCRSGSLGDFDRGFEVKTLVTLVTSLK